jgi:hypothetical protein
MVNVNQCSARRLDDVDLTTTYSIGVFMVIQTNLSGIEQSGRSSGAQSIDEGHRPSNGPGPNVMDAATLAGDSVVNAAGEDLGKIEAIMLDVTSGRIAYAVLSFGGFLGMGKKLFALP